MMQLQSRASPCQHGLRSLGAPSIRPLVARPRFAPQAILKGNQAPNTTSQKKDTVVPEPSFAIPITLGALSALSAYEGWTPAAWLAGILGTFLAVQATRVRFQFEADALEVVIAGQEQKETENAFVGGRNRWRYDTFVNWELWWPNFPVLVYFKETQTKPEGQIHFFPVIFNGKQLYDVMLERCGPTQNSGRKD